jgi:hypothetical protein
MPKYKVCIAREETTLCWVEVNCKTKSKAEDLAWEIFNEDSSILEKGEMVHADEYIDFVEEIYNA